MSLPSRIARCRLLASAILLICLLGVPVALYPAYLKALYGDASASERLVTCELILEL